MTRKHQAKWDASMAKINALVGPNAVDAAYEELSNKIVAKSAAFYANTVFSAITDNKEQAK